MSGIIGDNVGRASGLIKSAAVSQDAVKVASGTITGGPSELILDGCFDTTYIWYELFLMDFWPSSDAVFYIQMRDGGATTTGSYYNSISSNPNASGSTPGHNMEGDWLEDYGWEIAGNSAVNSSHSSSLTGKVIFFMAAGTKFQQVQWKTAFQESSEAGQWSGMLGHGNYLSKIAVYDGFRLYPSAGTISGGFYTLIGYKQ